MNVLIRADASAAIGSGHVMRCLTLAHSLRAKGAVVSFVSRELPGNLIRYVESKGFAVHRLAAPSGGNDAGWLGVDPARDAAETAALLAGIEQQTDWLIVDHYGLDRQWESRMRPYVRNIMAIDDLANREHDCDILLDQNLYADMEQRYEGLLPPDCRQLLGPAYVLLRDEFYQARRTVNRNKGPVERILIFFGGSDPTNETVKALRVFRKMGLPDIALDVVVGAANPERDQIKKLCESLPNARFHCQIDNMAELMAKADFSIGAGGSSLWERCFLGLPSLTVIVADNQIKTSEAAAASGATWNLGESKDVTDRVLERAIREMATNEELRWKMTRSAWKLLGDTRTEIADLILAEYNRNK
jgi:UDP-2,4-diacetamido-2,4,6-trideoxy-beta-L-altropyranose hydrolase